MSLLQERPGCTVGRGSGRLSSAKWRNRQAQQPTWNSKPFFLFMQMARTHTTQKSVPTERIKMGRIDRCVRPLPHLPCTFLHGEFVGNSHRLPLLSPTSTYPSFKTCSICNLPREVFCNILSLRNGSMAIPNHGPPTWCVTCIGDFLTALLCDVALHAMLRLTHPGVPRQL